MKVSKSQLVEILSREILSNVSRQVREIVREEIDIEKKRLRRQILEEVRESMGSNGNGQSTLREAMAPAKRKPFQNVVPQRNLLPQSPKKYTGSSEIDSILNEIRVDDVPDEDSSDMGDGFGQPRVSQEEVDVANFNPKMHDPSQVDWSAMVEAVDQRAKEKRQSGLVSLPM